MAGYLLYIVAVINCMLKNLYFLLGNVSAAHSADQLLRLAREHAAADYFNTSTVVFHNNPNQTL